MSKASPSLVYKST